MRGERYNVDDILSRISISGSIGPMLTEGNFEAIPF